MCSKFNADANNSAVVVLPLPGVPVIKIFGKLLTIFKGMKKWVTISSRKNAPLQALKLETKKSFSEWQRN
jgi:hypothetical protein